jgi:TPR repeat protein
VKESAPVWKARVKSLEAARKAARRGEPEAFRELGHALHHVRVTARALGRRAIARGARRIAHALARQAQLETDRRFLERIGRLGFLSPDAVTALAARWEKEAARGARRAARAADGPRIQRLRRRLERLARKGSNGAIQRLEKARQRLEATLARSLEGRDDAALRRYRRAAVRARCIAEDLAALGLPPAAPHAGREAALEGALVRWNDLRKLRRRLLESREEAELRGSVTQAAEIEHLLAALEPPIGSLRAAAVTASRRSAQVVPLRRAANA